MSKEIDDYKGFVDALVKLKSSAYAHWMRRGYWPKTSENESINKLVSRLSAEDRELLASAIESARTSGIHDVLAYLQEQMDRKRLKIVIAGSELPNSPFGTELHYDFVSRLNGDEWPKH